VGECGWPTCLCLEWEAICCSRFISLFLSLWCSLEYRNGYSRDFDNVKCLPTVFFDTAWSRMDLAHHSRLATLVSCAYFSVHGALKNTWIALHENWNIWNSYWLCFLAQQVVERTSHTDRDIPSKTSRGAVMITKESTDAEKIPKYQYLVFEHIEMSSACKSLASVELLAKPCWGWKVHFFLIILTLGYK
jgi:hypothetical protein